MTGISPCPFCGFIARQSEYELLLHIETLHAEGESPFVVADGRVSCPNDGCAEQVSSGDLTGHLQLHELETSRAAEPPVSNGRQSSNTKSSGESVSMGSPPERRRTREATGSIEAWKSIFNGYSSQHKPESSQRSRHKSKQSRRASDATALQKGSRNVTEATAKTQQGAGEPQFSRLGKSELGRFAHEKQMPGWLVDLLRERGQVLNNGLVPVIGQLLDQSPSTEYAYICHPDVQHVSKLRREGGFCGYRNIQMLTSHVIKARLEGSQQFSDTFPDIFQIQDLIEKAWDMGFNSQGRVETGGIKGTRKYIGTPEAQALFCSLGVPCSVQAFKDKESQRARDLLLQTIENYFRGGVTNVESKVHLTALPPIYFQHPGHSLTIVGFEKKKDGQANLLVFDPTYRGSDKLRHLVGKIFRHKSSTVDEALQPYRRGTTYLRKYHEFEVL